MKDLISQEDVVNVANLHKYRLEIAAKALMKILGLDEINKIYHQAGEKSGIEFIEEVFNALEIQIHVPEKDLANIPANGRFITVGNHPYGALDGLILIYLFCKSRPDFRVMANFLLKEIEPLSSLFFEVNPFEDLKEKSSLTGLKQALGHLQQDRPLGIFPAGEVSAYKTNALKVTDRVWNTGAIKFIMKAEAPVVPVYFSGNNSMLFHLLGIIKPKLRTAALPKEMLKKKGRTIHVRIGKPISLREQRNFPSADLFGRFLRAKTYALGSSLQVKKFYLPKIKFKGIENPVTPEEIIPPVSTELLEKEINALPEENKMVSQMEFDVFIAYSTDIPNVLNEIGRLREETFRSVGEGTNLAIDVDEYDLYYHHLILWDREAKKVAGGYRIGKGNDIISKYGVSGFYTQSLFKMGRKFRPILEKTIELGRSYVTQEYQNKRLPLFLLWKGIMAFLLRNEEYQYILGPVSISNEYSKVSKKLMVAFVKAHYYDHELAKWIKPTKPFNDTIKDSELKALLDSVGSDLKDLDRLIGDIEPINASVPVLLKKYINQNAKIIGFNVDPKFNNALDGLMILNLHDLPEDSIENLKDDINKSMS
ncbi:lysophospholipid acyltransferase family protein [Luteibaculum oceani]|uniref:Lysophospholipid acyltransferase family protein n=1 Tax=Luteibaculum oceani TaxID=1294296 RepID=A0A5C6V4H8_9FLAO|nr:GNAT family N-acyltransferase [Luteibaculum oceani]TXC78375.1 lysophospholipid acyltransferase family protein [Luteibaculum oceani]